MLSAIKSFLSDENGFDLTQFAVYTAAAGGLFALIWFTYLRDRVKTAGEKTGGVIEKGYSDIPQ